MRIARLDLLAYGHFQSCSLDFPPAPTDFHLVLGANEAGKSTTLAAVTDLLFGFGKSTPFNFRFDSDLLRIGALLEDDAGPVELRRRKGRGDTLEDPTGKKLPDAVLTRRLHGLTRETFNRSFGLNHEELRRGGHTMLKTEGDIGQALFAAGSGLLGVQTLLAAIDKECDLIWAARHASKRSYHKAEDDYSDAIKRLKASEVRPKQWNDALAALAGLEAEQKELETEHSDLGNRRNRVQRIRRLADPVQRRATLHDEISAIPPSPFDPAAEAAFAAALDQVRHNAAAALAAEAEAEALRTRLGDRPPDPTALAHAAEIKALTSQAGAALKAAADLPVLQQTLRQAAAAAAALAHQLGWDAASLTAMQAAMPTTLLSSGLAALLETHAALQERHTKAAATHRRAVARQLAAEQKLAAQPAAAADDALAAALRTGERALARHDGLALRRRTRDKAAAAELAAFRKLAPWTGDAAALAGLAVPSEPELDRVAQALDRAHQDQAAAVRDRDEAAREIARLELESRQLAHAGGAVPWSGLLRLRTERDAQWQAIEAHLLGASSLETPATAATQFRSAITETDALADRRFDRAEASARLVTLGHEQARHELERHHAETRRQAATDAATQQLLSWTARLQSAGLPPMSPAQTRQWQADQARALEAATALHEADALLEDDTAAIATACATLHAAIAQPPNPAAALPALIAAAAALARRIAEAATERTRLETELRGARETLEDAAREQHEAAQAIAGWNRRWHDATTGSKLDGILAAEAGPHLALVTQLRLILDKATTLQIRVHDIEADLDRFAARTGALAQACQLDSKSPDSQQLAQDLADRLQAARSTAEARRDLAERLAAQDETHNAALRQHDAARRQLQPLIDTAGSEDLTTLAAALQQFARRREAESKIRQADADILKEAPGVSLAELIEEVAAADLDAARQEDERLSRQIKELTDRMMAQAQRIGEARTGVAGLNHGTAAATAAADAEQAMAAMAAEAEAYLLKRTQAVMLNWAIDRYRERRQSPMLARAGQLFRTLTLGRYTELRIRLDDDSPRLIALREQDCRAIAIPAMSDGTSDQLFLALRLAALEHSIEAGVVVPFLADDLFVNFDDRRAEAGFKVLGEIARKTQVLFFTHHEHLRELADRALHPHIVSACELA